MIRQITICTSLLFFATPVLAQDVATEELEKKTLEEKKEKDPDGWKVKGTLGFTGNLTDSRKFVGSDDGTTVQIGVLFTGAANWKSGQHGWENDLKLQEGLTRTPQLKRFVKSADELLLKSTYLYRFTDPDWLGVFGRVKLVTQLFNTDSVQADAVRYQEGTTIGNDQAAGDAIRLTGPFEPLTLRESAGAFAKPYSSDEFKLKTSLGIAAQHTIVRSGRVVQERVDAPADNGLPIIILKDLESQNDFGIEITADATGIIIKDLLSWRFSVDLFQPVLPGVDEGQPSGLDRLNLDLLAGLSLKLAKWLSLDYQLTVRRQPVILEEWQIQNQFLLTAGFDII